MNKPSDRNQLLNDVLLESRADDFREALLDETLRHARGRRRTRLLLRAAPLVLVVGLVWFFYPVRRVAETPVHIAVERVCTQPLASTSSVWTQPLAAEFVVTTTPCAYVVRTRSEGEGFRLIGDEELMALAAPRPAVLMRLGPTSQTLIFADGKDEDNRRPN